ncbi:hypothetical protein ACFXNW_01325 [Nocardia sp. NPDC059180]|uniref:hypothetical protein n=1 Tax=Nocardia sp. NPDC059180 TaxID=3346761 RepID=UPI0036C1F94F
MTRWFDRVLASADLSTAVLEQALAANDTDADHPMPDPTPRTEQPVTLAELVAEGFGQASIDTLAAQLPADEVLVDDIGRRCVTRTTARRLFTERAEADTAARKRAEQYRAEATERGRAERAARRQRQAALDKARADRGLEGGMVYAPSEWEMDA